MSKSKSHLGHCTSLMEKGVNSVSDMMLLSMAAVRDLLDGTITVQMATVINTSVDRVIKLADFKARHGNKSPLALTDQTQS